MKLIYVRHGEVAIPNGPLSERGIKQAEGTVDYIAPENPVKIYCSPQLRAKQTAEIIAKGLNLEVEVLQELNERMQVSIDDEEALRESTDGEPYLAYGKVLPPKNSLPENARHGECGYG